MCPEIFVKVCRHWLTKFSLERSGGRSRRSVGTFNATFTILGGKKLRHLLFLIKTLLQNFCSSYCSWWCQISWGRRCLPYLPGVEIWRKMVYIIFNKVFLSVSRLFYGQLSGLDDFLVHSQKCVLSTILVLWIGGSRLQDLIDPQTILKAYNIINRTGNF